jgi:hypothetical protein
MPEAASAQPARAIAFNVDADALASLRQALPDWEIDAIDGATPDSLAHHWNPGAAQLLVVGASVKPAVTLGLCHFLSFCAEYALDVRAWEANSLRPRACAAATPLLVLVQPDDESFTRAALRAGAHRCLTLPIHPLDVVDVLAPTHAGNHRQKLNFDRAAIDRWRDDGGQG